MTHEILPDEPEFVFIRWEEPKAPNAVIILYEVNYKRISDSEVCTVPHLEQWGNSKEANLCYAFIADVTVVFLLFILNGNVHQPVFGVR